jgi:large subunit ribosomal protein L47
MVGTTSPSTHNHHPLPHDPLPDVAGGELAERGPALDALVSSASPSLSSSSAAAVAHRGFTPKGKPIPARPARSTAVNLPSGFPEPRAYPPPAEYLAGLDAEGARSAPHPLWQFFHVPAKALERPTGAWERPMDMGSLEVEGGGEGEAQSASGE